MNYALRKGVNVLLGLFDREKLEQKDLLEKLALWGFKDLLERVVLRDYVEYLVLLWVHFVLEFT